LFPSFEEANLVMVYLLGVVLVAARWGRGPSVLASILSVAAFDFFFVLPHLTFAVSDTQYFVTFGVMLLVALIISTLTVRLRLQAQAARERERRTAVLYAASRDLAATRGLDNLLAASVRHIADVFQSQVVALIPAEEGRLRLAGASPTTSALAEEEEAVAQWVFTHGEVAGMGTDTLPGAKALYLPLTSSHGPVGVLGVSPADSRQLLAPEQLHLLETFANQTALAIERARFAEEAERTRVQIETERLRNTLLSSVSHDLRTPLATITGAASSLVDDQEALDADAQRELAQTLYEEAARLNRLVGNLLDMTRLESGTVAVNKAWESLEEVIGGALARLESLVGDRPVTVHLPPTLPLIPLDSVLLEQVLINLLENALKYTPPGSPIEVSATVSSAEVQVAVADRGPGIPAGDVERVFDKFYRGQGTSGSQGAGLGLAICRAIIEAHGGRIWAEARPNGGAVFCFTLPVDSAPPTIEPELVMTGAQGATPTSAPRPSQEVE
jgi:two-component system sensor histidine kinase KdpD